MKGAREPELQALASAVVGLVVDLVVLVTVLVAASGEHGVDTHRASLHRVPDFSGSYILLITYVYTLRNTSKDY